MTEQHMTALALANRVRAAQAKVLHRINGCDRAVIPLSMTSQISRSG